VAHHANICIGIKKARTQQKKVWKFVNPIVLLLHRMNKSLEIQTSQNVHIHFELATARERVFAQLIDHLVKLIIYFIINAIILALKVYSESILMLTIAPIMAFYTLISEYLWDGQTIGKRLLAIQVIRVDGQQVTFTDYLIRWVFRIVDIYLSLGLLAIIFASSTDRNQRLGDKLAHCTVIRRHTKLPIQLKDILKIESRSTYEPMYPLITQFKEQDIFLIKNTIERYNRFKNPAHLRALKELSSFFQDRVQCSEPITNDVQFLRTLIKDYVVLTR
jgi:uncharacterized RDD family membrane protein YckC